MRMNDFESSDGQSRYDYLNKPVQKKPAPIVVSKRHSQPVQSQTSAFVDTAAMYRKFSPTAGVQRALRFAGVKF